MLWCLPFHRICEHPFSKLQDYEIAMHSNSHTRAVMHAKLCAHDGMAPSFAGGMHMPMWIKPMVMLELLVAGEVQAKWASILGALPSFKVLDLRNCRLRGTLPPSWASAFPFLEVLSFTNVSTPYDALYDFQLPRGRRYLSLRRLTAEIHISNGSWHSPQSLATPSHLSPLAEEVLMGILHGCSCVMPSSSTNIRSEV